MKQFLFPDELNQNGAERSLLLLPQRWSTALLYLVITSCIEVLKYSNQVSRDYISIHCILFINMQFFFFIKKKDTK